MGVTGDFCGVNLGARFRRIDSRGAKPAEPGRRWEANYKLKLGQRLASRLPSGGAGGRELRRRENKARLAVFWFDDGGGTTVTVEGSRMVCFRSLSSTSRTFSDFWIANLSRARPDGADLARPRHLT